VAVVAELVLILLGQLVTMVALEVVVDIQIHQAQQEQELQDKELMVEQVK